MKRFIMFVNGIFVMTLALVFGAFVIHNQYGNDNLKLIQGIAIALFVFLLGFMGFYYSVQVDVPELPQDMHPYHTMD